MAGKVAGCGVVLHSLRAIVGTLSLSMAVQRCCRLLEDKRNCRATGEDLGKPCSDWELGTLTRMSFSPGLLTIETRETQIASNVITCVSNERVRVLDRKWWFSGRRAPRWRAEHGDCN